MTRLPSIRVNNLSPSYSSDALKNFLAIRLTMLSAECSCSPSGLSMWPAVTNRTRPKK